MDVKSLVVKKEDEDQDFRTETNFPEDLREEIVLKIEPVAVEFLEDHLEDSQVSEEIKYEIDPLDIETFNEDIKETSKILKCDHCSYISHYENNVKKHVLRCHTKEPLRCDKCKFTTKTAAYLKYHMIDKHNKKKKLKINPVLAKSPAVNYQKHVVVEKRSEDFTKWLHCAHCDYKAKRYTHFSRHFSMCHSGMSSSISTAIKWFQCEKCSSKYKYSNNLKKHLKKVHETES